MYASVQCLSVSYTCVSINLRTYPTCTRTAQDSAARNGQEVIQKIAELTESMLMDFDQLLTIDDVIKGRTCAAAVHFNVPSTTSEL